MELARIQVRVLLLIRNTVTDVVKLAYFGGGVRVYKLLYVPTRRVFALL